MLVGTGLSTGCHQMFTTTYTLSTAGCRPLVCKCKSVHRYQLTKVRVPPGRGDQADSREERVLDGHCDTNERRISVVQLTSWDRIRPPSGSLGICAIRDESTKTCAGYICKKPTSVIQRTKVSSITYTCISLYGIFMGCFENMLQWPSRACERALLSTCTPARVSENMCSHTCMNEEWRICSSV